MMVPVTTGVITRRSLLMHWLKAISTKGCAEAHAEQRGENFLRRAAARLDDEAGAEDGAEKAEAGALQAEQPGADRTDALGLDEGAEAGNEQRHADQIGHVGTQAQGTADDEGGGDDADETRQHVLQRREECREWGRAIVQPVDEILLGCSGAAAARIGCGHGQACHLLLYGHGLSRVTAPLSASPAVGLASG